jgi:hypothetical protein
MLVAVAAAAALIAGTPGTASATAATSCTAWGFLGTCRTASIPSSSGHTIYYNIGVTGWGNIYDAGSGRLVGGSNLVGSGSIGGLYSSYYLVVRNASSAATVGNLFS